MTKVSSSSQATSQGKSRTKGKPVIVHISNDYPDILDPNKTKAISRLVEGTPEYRHVVYSLNRVSQWDGLAAVEFGEDKIAVSYGALPKGFFWGRRLKAVGQWILNDLNARGIVPDVIQAHKITVEGVVGHDLAQVFGCPLVCDIQGDTDTKLLKHKRSLKDKYMQIARESVLFFPYAPWAIAPFEEQLGLSKMKCRNLPVVPGFDSFAKSDAVGQDKLLSIFHLDTYGRKNIEGMIEAVKILSATRPDLRIDVYGRGSPKNFMKVQALIEENKVEKHIRLCGSVPNGDVQKVMGAYAGFVLPSKAETFGLVFAEALFSGLPVLFNKKQAISGYFDESLIGYACDVHDNADIAAGIAHILDHEEEYKGNIAKMQDDGTLDIFKRDAILQTYKDGLEYAIGKTGEVEYSHSEKICFAASGGGHLRQLLQLEPLWKDYPNYYFMTEKTSLGESLLKDHRAVYVPHFAFGQRKTEGFIPFAVSGIKNFFVSTKHFFKERPDVIVSTGAGAAFFTLFWGWVFRKKIVYIESIARVTEVSLFGKLAARFAGKCIVQWPSMEGKLANAEYCSPLMVDDWDGTHDRTGAVVTVGTIMPFDRMVQGVEGLVEDGKIEGPVSAQVGKSEVKYEAIEAFESCPYEELNAKMEAADLVICHGGSGSILGSLKAGAYVVAMARSPAFNEHYDDHQKDITKAFEDMDLISVAKDEHDLERAIEEARSRPRRTVNIDPKQFVKAIKRFLNGQDEPVKVTSSDDDNGDKKMAA